MKKLVNPQYEYLSPLLDLLIQPDYFETHGEVLYDVGRNLVKRFRLGETDVVVKRFGRITSFNRLMYATVRESKAMRAYTYASKLRSMGISTPDEIAVLEICSEGVLQESYFVSVYSDYRSLLHLRDFTWEQRELFPLLDALAIWLREVHDKGVLHQDLNIGNILYREHPDGKFAFQLIDNNRMKFCPQLTLDMRLKDLCRLSTNLDLFHYVLNKYLSCFSCDCYMAQLKGGFYKFVFEYRQIIKRKLKRRVKSKGSTKMPLQCREG